jgi:hypothetical protein
LKDPTSILRSATRRAKSDVANKLVSMFLHELSRSVSKDWRFRVDRQEYENLVRECFGNRCPYCRCSLAETPHVNEHLDGMNRYRAGLHVPGNVLVACRKCNGEKRRDDQQRTLSLATSGWASFLSHNGEKCAAACKTCLYWKSVWRDDAERERQLLESLERIQGFRDQFAEFRAIQPTLMKTLPLVLTKLYSDCQAFAASEIRTTLERFNRESKASG